LDPTGISVPVFRTLPVHISVTWRGFLRNYFNCADFGIVFLKGSLSSLHQKSSITHCTYWERQYRTSCFGRIFALQWEQVVESGKFAVSVAWKARKELD
jgi:hypothetical protein